jgi:hypothetical protein
MLSTEGAGESIWRRATVELLNDGLSFWPSNKAANPIRLQFTSGRSDLRESISQILLTRRVKGLDTIDQSEVL